MNALHPDRLRGDFTKALFFAAATALLASCSSPGVKVLDRPVVLLEGVAALYEPDRLSTTAEGFLNERNLLAAYRKDPSSVLAGLGQTASGKLSTEDRIALAEMCSDTAQRFAGKSPSKALGYFLAASKVSYGGLRFDNGKPNSETLLHLYNFSTGQVAKLAFEAGKTAGTTSAAVAGPWGTYRYSWQTGGNAVQAPDFLDRLGPASFLKVTKLKDSPRHRVEGVGDAMVGYRDYTAERAKENPLLTPAGMALPLSATAEFPGDGDRVRLTLHQLLEEDQVRFKGRTVALSADYTAALMTLLNFRPVKGQGLKALLHPSHYVEDVGLYAMEPFRKDKIPLVFVHGLASDPSTWTVAVNMVWGDPVLRERYQVLLYSYTSGFPAGYDAALLRHKLQLFREEYQSPLMDEMVLVGHSLGGVLTSGQIRNSGDRLLDVFFDKPLDEIDGFDAKQKEAFRTMLVYEANPDIERAVFMAAVHRGSYIAGDPIGWLGSALISLPKRMVRMFKFTTTSKVEGLTPVGRETLKHPPNSITDLKPHAPVLEGIVNQPVRKGVIYHSVIGRAHPSQPLAESSDTVVPYWSSHLDGAASEKIVHTIHTEITGNPDALAEVRRILYLHVGLKAD